MIRKWVKLVIGLFAANAVNGQIENISETVSFIERFDMIISKDTTEVSISEYMENKQSFDNQEIILVYDPAKKYSSVFQERIICSASIQEELKLEFVEAAFQDKKNNIFKYFYGRKCPCLATQPKLAKLFYTYFRETSQNSQDRYEKYHFLEYVTKNRLPEDIDLINQYFNQRTTLEYLYGNETKLPINLIVKNEVEKALGLTEMFVTEQASGRIKYIYDGDHYEKENLFALLYFEGNESVKKKTLDLAFNYYNNITRGYTFSLGKFLKYIDPNRYWKSIENWLIKYESMDTSIYSNNNGYCSLLATDGKVIAEKQGKIYWDNYLESKSRWKDSNTGFEQTMLNIAIACMKGISGEKDKLQIIDYILQNHRYFKAGENLKNSRYLKQFLEVLFISNPNISEEDLKSFLPSRYKQYETWKNSWNEVVNKKNTQFSHSLEERFSIYERHGFRLENQIDEYDLFLSHIGRLHDFDIIRETGNTIWFDTEGGMFPLDYTELFNNTFLPVLLSNGIEDLDITEKRTMEEGKCIYEIQIDNKENFYTFNYTDKSDWYEVKPFVKSINLALKDKNYNLRLIYLDTQDQTTLLGLFDPNKFLPLAEEIKMYCYAVAYNDELMKNDYR